MPFSVFRWWSTYILHHKLLLRYWIQNDSKFFSCIMVKSDLIVKLSEQLTCKPTPPPLL